jgi:hypothetical protein
MSVDDELDSLLGALSAPAPGDDDSATSAFASHAGGVEAWNGPVEAISALDAMLDDGSGGVHQGADVAALVDDDNGESATAKGRRF